MLASSHLSLWHWNSPSTLGACFFCSCSQIRCDSYFSHCCDKILDKRSIEKGPFWLTGWKCSLPCEDYMWSGVSRSVGQECDVAGYIVSTVRKLREMNLVPRWLFSKFGTAAHRVCLSSSVKSLSYSHRQAQRCVVLSNTDCGQVNNQDYPLYMGNL